MEILKGGDVGSVPGHGANAARCGGAGRQRGDARDVVTDRSAADGFFVVEGFAAERRVDDQVYLSRFDQVNDVRTPFVHFVNRVDFDAGARQSRGRTARGRDAESGGGEIFYDGADMFFVVVVDADENDARKRQPLTSGQLRLGERQAEGRRDAHDLAGGAHFGAENRIDAPEFAKRKDGRLDGVEIADGELFDSVELDDRQMQVPQLATGHQPRRAFRERNASGLANVGNRARGARVDFEDVDRVVLNRVLDIHQADDVQGARETNGVVADLREDFGLQRDRRQYAGRIAGVDAGFFDVLHDAADDDVFAVGECVDVDFGCILKELVDQDGALGIRHAPDLRGLRDIFFDGFQIVGNDHGAAAEYVAGPHEDRQA